MFQARRSSAQGNVKVGTLAGLPTPEDIGYVLEQAHKHRGRFAEVSWSVANTGVVFQLTAKIVAGQPVPAWMLYGGPPGNSQLIWGHNSNDLTLIHNLVMLECDKPIDGTNTVSAGALDNMLNTNVAQGAAPASSKAPSTGHGGAAPAAAPAGASPGNQWLQNLSESVQSAQAAAAPAPTAVAPALTPAAVATMSPAIQNSGDLLDGSLSNIGVADLFHYLTNNRMTGRLAIANGANAGEAFFQAGEFRHAATLETKGENALFDMATWTDGEFQFHAEEQTPQRTVQAEGKEIVEGCKMVLAYFRALIDKGLHPASYLVRVQELDRANFDRVVKGGLPLDSQSQYRIYQNSTGDRTFSEILRCSPMVRAEWIPLVFNLIATGVLQISDRAANVRPGQYLEGEPINTNAIGAFVAHITQPNGFLAPGAFLYLLQQEYHRHERTGSSFALAFFSMAQTNMLDGNVTPLDPNAFLDAVRRIHQAKRKLDVLGQFDPQNCAIMMPETDAAGAAVFAHRIIDMMKKPPLTGVMDGAQLVYSFGIAAIPDDVRDLETLIAAVRVAKNKSRMMGAPIILHAEG
jgi:GGDEF domain-containing protein